MSGDHEKSVSHDLRYDKMVLATDADSWPAAEAALLRAVFSTRRPPFTLSGHFLEVSVGRVMPLKRLELVPTVILMSRACSALTRGTENEHHQDGCLSEIPAQPT